MYVAFDFFSSGLTGITPAFGRRVAPRNNPFYGQANYDEFLWAVKVLGVGRNQRNRRDAWAILGNANCLVKTRK